MSDFDFLEKFMGIVSPGYLLYDFSGKMFPIYILFTDQIYLSFTT